MKNKYLQSIVVLTALCLLIAAALGAVNYITAPIIEDNEIKKLNAAFKDVDTGDDIFEPLDLSSYSDMPATVDEIRHGDKGGYVVKLTTKGYQPDLNILVGIKDGKITGAKTLSSNETLGFEKTYGETAIGSDIESIDSLDTIAGATMTTKAYKNALKDALGAVSIIEGGGYDTRTEEQIRLDEALPEANGEFTALFITEYLAGLTKVFSANNGTGYVLVFSDEYIAADAEGNISSDSANATAAVGFIEELKESAESPISLDGYQNIPASVKKISMTAGGNYIFELESAPHQYSQIPINVKLAISADGKIIDCLTVSQGEGAGYGDKCAESEYYKQYVGKNEDNYNTVTIAGATQSANKYLGLVADAYTALEILKGGN